MNSKEISSTCSNLKIQKNKSPLSSKQKEERCATGSITNQTFQNTVASAAAQYQVHIDLNLITASLESQMERNNAIKFNSPQIRGNKGEGLENHRRLHNTILSQYSSHVRLLLRYYMQYAIPPLSFSPSKSCESHFLALTQLPKQ